MNIKDTEQKIQDLQIKIKALAAKRDGVIRQAGSEEVKLQEAYGRLKVLGVENPEKLSLAELEALASQLQEQLDAAVTDLTKKVDEGEKLLATA